MYGFSVYLNKDLDGETKDYINDMKKSGFEGVFTSCHIPEDNQDDYLDRLIELGKITKDLDLELMVDISTNTLSNLGVSHSSIDKLKVLGVTAIRADFGISFEDIAKLSRKIKVALNASSLRQKDVYELKTYGAYFSNLEAWHNYYPRPETGLGNMFFKDKNKWLENLGLDVMAFVAGDKELRGPIYEGLPTLEEHRYKNVFESALELKKRYKVSKIYIGDPKISPTIMDHFRQYIINDIYILHSKINDQYRGAEILKMTHTNREDSAEYVIRSKESRNIIKESIKAENTIERLKGSITLDNFNYGRYEGEMQITKRDLPKDKKVNIMGKVASKDLGILQYINGGDKFKIEF